MKRVISLILVICFMALALVACGGNKNTGTSGTPGNSNSEETDVLDKWENVKFEGDVLNVLARKDLKVSKEWEQEEGASDDDGLGQIVALRNEVVEGSLGLEVRVTFMGEEFAQDSKNFMDQVLGAAVRNDVDSGSGTYDIVACYGYVALAATFRDLWANLLDKQTFPYFDFSQPCWNQSLVKNGTIANQMYICAGDMNLSMYDSAMVIWYNKDLHGRLEDGSPEDIQDTVIAGKWTYDKLFDWAEYYENIDDKGNKGDIFGISMNGAKFPTEPFDAIPYAWDIDFMTYDEQTQTYDYNFIGNTKAEEAMNKLRAFFTQEGVATEALGDRPEFWDGGIVFDADKIWFSKEACMSRREMTDRFAILPWPKYDEAQEDYATTSQDYFTTLAVVNHSESATPTKGEQVSAYLQFSTEYSRENVRDVYFKEIVEGRNFGQFADGTTEKSQKIFNEYIIDKLEYDFSTIYCRALNDVLNVCWRSNVLIPETNTPATATVESAFRNKLNAYEQALTELYKSFGVERSN